MNTLHRTRPPPYFASCGPEYPDCCLRRKYDPDVQLVRRVEVAEEETVPPIRITSDARKSQLLAHLLRRPVQDLRLRTAKPSGRKGNWALGSVEN